MDTYSCQCWRRPIDWDALEGLATLIPSSPTLSMSDLPSVSCYSTSLFLDDFLFVLDPGIELLEEEAHVVAVDPTLSSFPISDTVLTLNTFGLNGELSSSTAIRLHETQQSSFLSDGSFISSSSVDTNYLDTLEHNDTAIGDFIEPESGTRTPTRSSFLSLFDYGNSPTTNRTSSNSPNNSPRNRRSPGSPISPEHIAHTRDRSISPTLSCRSVQISEPVVPTLKMKRSRPLRAFTAPQKPDLKPDISLSASPKTRRSSIDLSSDDSEPVVIVTPSQRREFCQLPITLSWLQDIQVEIWIDQEGFRTARSIFHLVGYTANVANVELGLGSINSLNSGIAEFRTIKRQKYVFHYGALDSLPVLRQVFIAGDESKDYITRQASLAIKENGVYFVNGIESADKSSISKAAPNGFSSHSEAIKLVWRFEYLVEDRKNSKGKIMPGEKVLTPLTFACSPGLLHASQGKKIKVMHVFRKNLITKLVSEKLETPKPPRSEQQLVTPYDLSSPLQTTNNVLSPTTRLEGHRRTKSSSASVNRNIPLTTTTRENQQSLRRSRAASIAIVGKVHNHDEWPSQSDDRRRSKTSPPTKLGGHIISPTRLNHTISSQDKNAAPKPILDLPHGLKPPSHHLKQKPLHTPGPTFRAETDRRFSWKG
ncbi:hypothetical protein C8Q75DRAFT_776883 [Abortiporus biennis]|nr:hypothetical protein C8Q75DRAFT_776883 [Abortiporus biennis]